MSRKWKVTTNDDTEICGKQYCRNLFNVVSKGIQKWSKKKRAKITGHAGTTFKLVYLYVYIT
jgi:hypothetical protein